MDRVKLTISIGLWLTAAGCDLSQKYVRPVLPVPAEAPLGPAYGQAQQGDTASLADLAWSEFFTEDRLRTIIRIGLENNRDLREAVANVEQARALYRVQRADLFPTISASGSAAYQKSPVAAGAAGAAGASGGRTDIYSASVGVSAWEIDLFGRVRNLSRAAQEQYFSVTENRNAAQTALVAEIATAWLVMAADQERLRIGRETLAAFRSTLELTQARFAAGISSELDVRQARTSFDQARSDIADAITLVALDQNALNLLAGTTLSADLLPVQLAGGGLTIENLPGGVPSEVLLRRPDVAAAEHQLRAANANIGAARAAFFPNISLTAAFGTVSLGLSSLFSSGSDFWSAAPSAAVPIFDFGRNKGNLRYAEATRDALVAQYEGVVQSAFREVADALARRGTIDEQLGAQVSLRSNAEAAYRLSEARFRAGIDPFLATLDSQRALYAAERSLLATRLAKQTNAVELYRALGGGLQRDARAAEPPGNQPAR